MTEQPNLINEPEVTSPLHRVLAPGGQVEPAVVLATELDVRESA